MVCPQQLMDTAGFQRELGDIPEMLLHGPAEAVVVAWNLRVAMALEKIAPMQPHLTPVPPHGLQKTTSSEKGQETPRMPLEEDKR